MKGLEIRPPVFRPSPDALHGVAPTPERDLIGSTGVGLQQPGAVFDRRRQDGVVSPGAPYVAASFAGSRFDFADPMGSHCFL